jgi:hypothetical protein
MKNSHVSMKLVTPAKAGVQGLLFFSLVLLPFSPAQAAKKKTEDLSNMIIQGENRLRAEPHVPPVKWTPDVYRDVQGVLQDVSLLGELKPPAIQDPPVILPSKLDTAKTASPWLERVLAPPVLRIAFSPPEQVAKAAAEWAFLVKNSNGEVFYEMKGKGSEIPKEVVWEGFSNKREALHVGFDYSYSFSAVDEAGNPSRHAGKPFRIDAFRYPRGGGAVFAFTPESLFPGRSSLKFSEDGLKYLAEAKDFLRSRYGDRVEVLVYEDDPKFAGFRAQAVREWLMKALDLPDATITAQGFPTSKGDGYRHVDIAAK